MRFFSTLAARYPGYVAGLLFLAFALWFAVPTLLGAPVDVTGGTGVFDLSDLRPYIVTEAIVATALLLLIALFGWGRFTGLSARSDPQGLRLASWYLWPAATVVALLWSVLAVTFGWQSVAKPILSLVVMSLLIGLFEETLFRGVVMQALRIKISTGWAIIVSAVVFGLFHVVNAIAGQNLVLTAIQICTATALGLFFGAITVQTRTLWPAIAMHALWDGFALSMALLVRLMPQTPDSAIPQPGLAALVVPAALTFAAWRIYRRWHRRTSQAEERQRPGISGWTD